MSKYLVFTREIIAPSLVVLGVLALAYITIYSSFFKITSIDCTQDFRPCENPALLSELDKLVGQNLFTLPVSKLKTRLLSGDFMLRELEIHRRLPSHLQFTLQSVYPVVSLQISGDPSWVIFDSQFRVIGRHLSDPNVPTVIVSGPLTLTVGKVIPDQDIIRSLALALRLRDSLISFKTLTLVDPDTLELKLDKGIVAIFTPKIEESSQLHSLQAVLSDATIMQGVHVIDVRFAQPVLR